jgi:hypothetical protein
MMMHRPVEASDALKTALQLLQQHQQQTMTTTTISIPQCKQQQQALDLPRAAGTAGSNVLHRMDTVMMATMQLNIPYWQHQIQELLNTARLSAAL